MSEPTPTPNMNDLAERLARLERQVDRLVRLHAAESPDAHVRAQHRLSEPEGMSGLATSPGADSLSTSIKATTGDLHHVVVAGGLTCVGLSGALVLRQLAVNAVVPLVAGVVVAVAYCLALIASGDLFRSRSRALEAVTLNLLGSMVLYALILESWARHHVIGIFGLHAALIGVLAISLVQAWRLPSRALAAAQVPAVFAASLVLLREAKEVFSTPSLMFTLCVGLMVLSLLREWEAPLWGALAALDVFVLLAVVVSSARGGSGGANAVPLLVVLSAFFVLNAAFFMHRNLVRKRLMKAPELVQIPIVILITFASALALLPKAGLPGTRLLGALGALLAVSCYVLPLPLGRSRPELGRNITAYRILACLYALCSVVLLLGGGADASAAWMLLSVVLVIVATRPAMASLRSHAWVFGYAALIAAGASRALFFVPGGSAAAASLPALDAFLFLAVGVAMVGLYWRERTRTHGAPALGLCGGGLLVAYGVVRVWAYRLAADTFHLPFATGEPISSFTMIGSVLLVLTTLALFVVAVRLPTAGLLQLSVVFFGITGARVFYDFLVAPVMRVIPQVFLFGIALFVASALYQRRRRRAGA